MPSNEITNPTPAEAYTLGVKHARLLRELYAHSGIVYRSPPTSAIADIDPDATNPGVWMVCDFVQKTYLNYVIPLLPAGATRRCKELGNPWAYADPEYKWDLEFDGERGVMKGTDEGGTATTTTTLEFPRLEDQKGRELSADIQSRAFMANKFICENGEDVKARMMLGGQPVDFGEGAREAIRAINRW